LWSRVTNEFFGEEFEGKKTTTKKTSQYKASSQLNNNSVCVQNKSDMLNGFIPLLVGGGALGCLSRGGGASDSTGVESGSNPPSGLHQLLSASNQMHGAMSTLLSSETGTINPDLLPMLQSVCGQVTQLRLEEATSPERKKNGER